VWEVFSIDKNFLSYYKASVPQSYLITDYALCSHGAYALEQVFMAPEQGVEIFLKYTRCNKILDARAVTRTSSVLSTYGY
jgi:hypothetical protein